MRSVGICTVASRAFRIEQPGRQVPAKLSHQLPSPASPHDQYLSGVHQDKNLPSSRRSATHICELSNRYQSIVGERIIVIYDQPLALDRRSRNLLPQLPERKLLCLLQSHL